MLDKEKPGYDLTWGKITTAVMYMDAPWWARALTPARSITTSLPSAAPLKLIDVLDKEKRRYDVTWRDIPKPVLNRFSLMKTCPPPAILNYRLARLAARPPPPNFNDENLRPKKNETPHFQTTLKFG